MAANTAYLQNEGTQMDQNGGQMSNDSAYPEDEENYYDAGDDDGTYDDNTYDDGTYDEGTYDEGTYDNETYDDGTYDDGTYDDGTYDDGTWDEDTYDDSAGMPDDGAPPSGNGALPVGSGAPPPASGAPPPASGAPPPASGAPPPASGAPPPASGPPPPASGAPPPASGPPHPASGPPPSLSGAPPSGHSNPIDPKYYVQSGPATAFAATFDSKICSYTDLLNAFKPTIQQANAGHGDTDYADLIDKAIQQVCQKIQVPTYIILCIILQESTGSLFVPTTYDADNQPTGGLMQCSGCEGLAASDTSPQLQDVVSMLTTGATHFAQCLTQQKGNVYEALRVYNSGSIAASGDLSDPASVGTPSYVNDVANRTHGWISGNGKPA